MNLLLTVDPIVEEGAELPTLEFEVCSMVRNQPPNYTFKLYLREFTDLGRKFKMHKLFEAL